ncbi:hypothetical protein HY522_08490 [bacterium]|nr:hypothetical protein [bacterium]
MTLIEATITAVIVGMIAVFLSVYYATANKSVRKSRDMSIAGYLATGLMEEISARRWDEETDGSISPSLGPDGGESASDKGDFDDVDDFNAFTELAVQYPDGAPLAGYAGWSRSVTVDFIDESNAPSAAPTERKRAVVVVQKDGVEILRISQLFAQNA